MTYRKGHRVEQGVWCMYEGQYFTYEFDQDGRTTQFNHFGYECEGNSTREGHLPCEVVVRIPR